MENINQFKDEKIAFLENEIIELKDAKTNLINDNIKQQDKINNSDRKTEEYNDLKKRYDKIFNEKQDLEKNFTDIEKDLSPMKRKILEFETLKHERDLIVERQEKENKDLDKLKE